MTTPAHLGRPQRYCSNACRQRAYRQRRDAEGTAGRPPAWPDRFVGRDHELAELSRLLRRTRLVTVVGTAGAGKSRLAGELAGQVHRSFPDGVHVVDVVSAREPGGVPAAVADVVGVTGPLVAALAERRTLLVLDGCEHVVDACRALVEDLLRGCPDVVVLVTSRQRLGTPGEEVLALHGLSLPARASEADLLGSEAVQLFLTRAKASAVNFELTPANSASVVEICERLDGLPLAVELVARTVRLLPVAVIADRLGDELFALTTGSRTGHGRHRSLHAAIESSYELLSEDERTVLHRLSVFAGGFGIDAAEAVCAGPGLPVERVCRTIAALRTKSLVMPSGTRFRVPEPIRLFGCARLAAAGEEGATRDRLTGWLSGLAGSLLDQAVFRPAFVERLRDERDNLVHALGWARSDERLLLTAALARTGEAPDRTRDALERCAPGAPHRGLALLEASELAWTCGDHDTAVRLAETGVALERRSDRPALLARLLLTAAEQRGLRGDSVAELAALRECLEITRRRGDELATATCLHALAWSALLSGELDDAARMLGEALPVIRATATPSAVSAARHTAGLLALELGDADRAAADFRDGLAADLRRVPPALEGLALVAVRTGHPRRGLRLIAAAERIGAEHNRPADERWLALVREAEAAAREALPTSRADAAVAEGRAFEVERVVAYALDPDVIQPVDTVTNSALPLTQREHQVATLVALGHTNQDIADQLGVSLRTVEKEVRSVRDRLGLRSRVQVAAWMADRVGDVFLGGRP
ncbi:LuxR family transcriptional regulator [Lentzea tibetensis]|uniref:LuxR family transcriptional regulator n=1 Tax=Lentzea tibetensis TaxID=2591470 RepID=A0A563ERW3_9PSEU|nr:LuxR C-terminal-related transcriptional regulator [Lentzea tibetensis]TWP50485.1 LuxR family transcriptional regulator [Lentzea tibetensis]